MSQRKGWDALSDNYRKRLTSKGITANSYSQGASLRAARGHRQTPERAKYRKLVESAKIDIRTLVPEYDDLTAFQREEIAKAFTVGVIGKARGPVDKKTGKRKPSTRQVDAKFDFLDLIQDLYDGQTESGFWKEFRHEYSNSFAAAA